jgi:hypothetical protein
MVRDPSILVLRTSRGPSRAGQNLTEGLKGSDQHVEEVGHAATKRRKLGFQLGGAGPETRPTMLPVAKGRTMLTRVAPAMSMGFGTD